MRCSTASNAVRRLGPTDTHASPRPSTSMFCPHALASLLCTRARDPLADHDGLIPPGRRAPPLPRGWALRHEQLRFFATRANAPALPSAWLPLHVPSPLWHREATAASYDTERRQLHTATAATVAHEAASKDDDLIGCNISARTGQLRLRRRESHWGAWDPWSGASGTRLSGAQRSGSYAALPLWLFSSYMLCPHGK